MSARIAICGATGLVGSAIAARLRPVAELVRLGRGGDADRRVDLRDPASITTLDLAGCDALVHAAGIVDEDFRRDSAATWRHATEGTAALVQRAIDAGVRSAVYVSTSHVYGAPRGRQTEASPPSPTTDYAIAHFASERFFARAGLAGRMRVLVLRPNAVFGVPSAPTTFDRWHLIPFAFPLSAIERGEIVLASRGEQRRNFVGTEDIAAHVAAFLAAAGPPGTQVVNPLGASTLRVVELAEMCAGIAEQLTGSVCRVLRAADASTESGDDFVYDSNAAQIEPRQPLRPTLETLMRVAREERSHGRPFGR